MKNGRVTDHEKNQTSERVWQPNKGLLVSSRPLLYFIIFHNIVNEKRLGSKRKIEGRIFKDFL